MIGERFGVDDETIGSIYRGETWSHVRGFVEPLKGVRISIRGSGNGRAKLMESGVREIRRLAACGLRTGQIAASLGVAKATVRRVLLGKAWAHVA